MVEVNGARIAVLLSDRGMVTHIVFRIAFVPADGKRHSRGLRMVVREQGRDVSFGVTLREFVSASFQAMCGGGGEATMPQTKKDADSGGGTSVHKNATGPKRANVPTRDEGSMAWDCCNPTSFYLIGCILI